MRPLFASCIVALTVIINSCSGRDQQPSLSEIIQQSVDAIGGEVALQAVESVWLQRNERTFTLRRRCVHARRQYRAFPTVGSGTGAGGISVTHMQLDIGFVERWVPMTSQERVLSWPSGGNIEA